jgi:hypothetical protein
MTAANRSPETLLEAVRYFAHADVALDFVARLRWPWRVLPGLWRQRGFFPQDPPHLEVQGVQAAVFGQGRNDLRGLAYRPVEVAPRDVAHCQLQERDQLL